ncbi:MAG: transposase [Thermodesulfobacteriota bacterium]
MAIQTFGDFLNFNPHCHVLCTDGVFYGSGWFKAAPTLDTSTLEKIFQHRVLKMLLRKGKITEEVARLILSWRHSGFFVHCGPRIQSGDEKAMENIARYSNVSRGRREKSGQDGLVPCILQSEESAKGYRKNWARLIQKIYEVDPLTCPRCKAEMGIIAFIERKDVIEKILKHLGLWEVKPRPPPQMVKSKAVTREPWIDYSESQVPPSNNGHYVDLIPPADLSA